MMISNIMIDGIPVIREYLNINNSGDMRLYPYAVGICIVGNVEV